MLFFPSADQSSKSLYVPLFRSSKPNTTADTTQSSMASVLLNMSNFIIDLANSVPKPMKIAGLAATFATQFAKAACYMTRGNTKLDLTLGKTLEKRDYSENLDLLLTQAYQFIASDSDNDTALCPTGNIKRGCFQLYGEIAKQYAISSRYVWLTTPKDFYNYTQELPFLYGEYKHYLCTTQKDIENRITIGLGAALGLTVLLGICVVILCRKDESTFKLPSISDEIKINFLKETLNENREKIFDLLNTLSETYQYLPEENDTDTIKNLDFIDPISLTMLKEAVKLPADNNISNYFELENLLEWLNQNATNPINRREAHISDIEPALKKQEEIINYLENKINIKEQERYFDLKTPLLRDEKEEEKEEQYFSINFGR